VDTRIIRREEKKVAERALKHWGVRAQLDKAVGVAAELVVAIYQYDRRQTPTPREHLLYKMAECSVTIEQLKLIIGVTDEQFQEYRAERWRDVAISLPDLRGEIVGGK